MPRFDLKSAGVLSFVFLFSASAQPAVPKFPDRYLGIFVENPATVEIPGWRISLDMYARDTTPANTTARQYDVEVRAEQLAGGVSLGIDSIRIDGLPWRDSVGSRFPMPTPGCNPASHFQYFYYCCLSTRDVDASQVPRKRPHEIMVRIYVNYVLEGQPHERALTFFLEGY